MLSLLKGLLLFAVTAAGVGIPAGHLLATTGHANPASRPARAYSGQPVTEPGIVDIGAFSSFPLSTPTPTPAPPTPAPADAAPPQPAPAPVTWSAPPPAPAPAPVYRPAPPPAPVNVSTQQALINSDRAAAGLQPLAWSSCLAGIAAQNAARMAAAGAISHAGGPSADLGCGLGSVQAGENVGYWSAGINDVQLNAMFMNSPEHRANIMGPYRYVGTAWAVAANGYAYIAVEFA